MLLVVGAFSLLSSTGLSIGRVLLENDVIVAEAKAGCTAVLFGRGRISELSSTPFDSLPVGAWKDTVTAGGEALVCSTHVGFVDAGLPDSVVTGPTGLKRMSITVWSDGMPGRICLTGITGSY
jgi:hypothetical protein